MHIAVDLDDVVVQFWLGLVEAVNREYGTDFAPVHQNDWDDNPVKKYDFGGGRNVWQWLEEGGQGRLWANMQAIPGAIGGIDRLRRDGHYVECVTSKPEWAEWVVWKWLGRWRPRFNRVTITRLDEPKWAVTNAKVLVDDRPDNIEDWHESGRPALLFTQPWNRTIDLRPGMWRVNNWHDVLRAIDNLGRTHASHG
jgi:5'(3')-deoxyribonucleotidase